MSQQILMLFGVVGQVGARMCSVGGSADQPKRKGAILGVI